MAAVRKSRGKMANWGADGLFNASKWSPRDSGLIGPVVLTPGDRKAFDP